MEFLPKECARQILQQVGGQTNLQRAAHCVTRLRLEIAELEQVNLKALEEIDGVKGVFYVDGLLQIILGIGTVNKVYNELASLAGCSEETLPQQGSKSPLLLRMVKALGGVFVPLLPAMAASGLLVGLLQLVGQFFPAAASSVGYQFLQTVSATAFEYLPVLVALSAAKIFGGSPYLAVVVGLCMIHPSLPAWSLFGFAEDLISGQGQVVPIVVAVWLLCKLEKRLHERVPEMLDLFITPLVSVLVTAGATFLVVGPVLTLAEHMLLQLVKWLLTIGFGVGSTLLGGIYSATVVCGLHHIYDVMEAGMIAGGGLNILMPIASAANIAQAGACFAVALRSHDKRTRSSALPAGLSAVLGITEPAIFGINLRFGKPFVCAMAGGAAGALVAALADIGAVAYGVTALPGTLIVLEGKRLSYLILLTVSLLVSFLLTLLVWREEDPYTRIAPLEALTGQNTRPQHQPEQPVAPTAPAITCEAGKALQPVFGRIVPLEQVPDPTFAAGYLGKGIGICPEDDTIYAPVEGTVASLAVTGHSVGLRAANGMELFIHVGINTVDLNGEGFTLLVQQNEAVKQGQPLLRFDRERIRAAGLNDMVIMTLVNSFSYQTVETAAAQAQPE